MFWPGVEWKLGSGGLVGVEGEFSLLGIFSSDPRTGEWVRKESIGRVTEWERTSGKSWLSLTRRFLSL